MNKLQVSFQENDKGEEKVHVIGARMSIYRSSKGDKTDFKGAKCLT